MYSNQTPKHTQNELRRREASTHQRRQKGSSLALEDNRASSGEQPVVQRQPNKTGLPDNLKSGMEQLSGMSLDHVKVHYNSTKPSTIQAHAYAQGSDIHVAPGQEKHLPHELGHVVQQAQGRVTPNTTVGGVAVNNNAALEKDADIMGAKALQLAPMSHSNMAQRQTISESKSLSGHVVQRNLNTHVLSGSGSGMMGNLFGTSTYSDLKSALSDYQNPDNDSQKKSALLAKMKTLGDKWLGDNSKKTDSNSATKRASIKALLSLVNDELTRIQDSSLLQKESKTFEKNLGLYTFNEARSKNAATAAINKMKQVMGVQANRALAGQVFGGDSAKYAGVVGKDVDTVMAAIDHGNLREKMTGFYNAALGPFKTMLDEHINLKGAMAGKSWDESKAALGTKGIDATGQGAIEERRNQINSYDSTSSADVIYTGAKLTGKIGKYKDVYMAPLDPLYRDEDDALKQGQRGVLAAEGRMDAMDAALKSPDSYNFNWNLFNYTRDDLQGTSSGKFDSTSTFKTIKTELDTFLAAAGQSNEKIISYKKLKASTEKWLKDNGDKTDENSVLKKQSLEQLQGELRKIYSSSNRTNADLTNGRFSAQLSDREKKFIASQRSDLSTPDTGVGAMFRRALGWDTPNVYDSTKKLPWEEGGTRFSPNPDNAWISKAINQLKMPVVAGPSGTTDRMLRALKFLGNPTPPVDFRLSLLGWMLTSNDHSFHEIMAVSKAFGLPYELGPYAYHHIAPLTIPDLRQNVCEQRMFPDELVYYSHLNDYILVQDSIDQPGNQSFDPKVIYNNRLSGNLKGQMSEASSAAIGLYTTGSYLIQNPTRESSDTVAGIKIAHHLKSKHELSVLKGKQETNPEQYSVAKLIAEGKLHNAALENALRDLPDKAFDPVYRGQNDGLLTSYKVGQVLTYNKFVSTSVKKSVANDFMNAATKTKTPVLFKIKAIKGKDIRPFSKYSNEGEILLMPPAKLKVTAVKLNQPADGDIAVVHTLVDCVQE